MDSYQMKQWSIGRVENLLEVHQNSLLANKEKFKNFYNALISNIDRMQLAVISSVGGISFSSVIANLYNLQQLQLILLSIASAGIVIFYIGMMIFKSRLSGKLWKIEQAYQDGIIAQNFMKGFVQLCTHNLDSINIDHINALIPYLTIIEGGITSTIVDKYEEAYVSIPSVFLPSALKNKYRHNPTGRLYSLYMDHAYSIYQNDKQILTGKVIRDMLNQEMMANENMIEEFSKLADSLIKRYSKSRSADNPHVFEDHLER